MNAKIGLALTIGFFIFSMPCLSAQASFFEGKVTAHNEPIAGVSVFFPKLKLGTITNNEGHFKIDKIVEGKHIVNLSFVGYLTITDTLNFEAGVPLTKNYVLEEDVLNIGEVVVTGSRYEIFKYNSPVIINTISSRIFETTQSVSISEGLNFSPGLRIENNCQNCGFTQLRMNGLDGAYAQILINSRPVFSALAGVYGLEMLPANMVDKIEVVRGGGSVLYGGNAIAGTVNIITKDPFENTFEVGINQSFIDAKSPDRTVSLNGAVVSNKLDKGINFFGFNRTRQPWDANGDGFSEIVKLKNNTFGFNAFWNVNKHNKLKVGSYFMNEFRRGGNKFELLPHQTDLTEQLQHYITSADISFEHFSSDFKHKFSIYSALQKVDRASYYGAGGRIINDGDTLTPSDVLAINAYGNSNDLSIASGLQYNYDIHEKILLIAGSEYNFNTVNDDMPGYKRTINQQVGTIGNYFQIEFKPQDKLTFLMGGRLDHVAINGLYNLAENRFEDAKTLVVFVPRLSALYSIMQNLKLRASFAQGYRGPQAFDEDLHIETVGGAARFVQLDPNLKTEKSNSSLLSLNLDKRFGKNQINLVLEGFYTQLKNPFIVANQTELPNGIAIITKRNAEGATVKGINLEANMALGSKFILQSGATLQTAHYKVEEEIWAPKDANSATPAVVTDKILRTPNAYGYFSVVYNPIKKIAIGYSGVITGSMLVPHVIDPVTEQTVLKNTPAFFENNIKINYTFNSDDHSKIQIFGGVQNLFNNYQKDFDTGMQRDAGYVYGPLKPRTLFMGLKFGLN